MTKEHSFVNYLESLAEDQDRGALAALRRGLGQPPGTAPEMYPYVVRRLPKNAYPNSWTEQTFYLVAALYALHPKSTLEGNMGQHFAHTLDPNPDHNQAIERRFTALLTAHPDDLNFYLRQAISFLKSRGDGIPVNWHRLMWDLLAWGYPDSRTRVQKQWAASFWRRPDNDDTVKVE
jgi:CRISPR system Cascade subunit CasB